MRIGILTGGGDAPGLNGIIEAVSKSLLNFGHEVIGICDGFEGVFEGRFKEIDAQVVNGIHAHAGTFLGTSNRCGTEGREEEFLAKYRELALDGLVVAGGDGTFAGLHVFKDQIRLMGVPKTIDNDLAGTDITFGYDTACSVVAEAVDALRATADAHRRIIVIEAMGRTAGWIALGGGMASYADVILIPERPFDRHALLNFVNSRHESGQRGLICVVSEGAAAKGEHPTVAFKVEGAPQEERLGGIAQSIAKWLEIETGWEGRHVVLGHLQRSKSPTTTDRFLTLAMGVKVAQLVHQGKWGNAAVYRDGLVQAAPLTDFMQPPRLIDSDHRWVQMAQAVGIFI
ncbi:MAG: ATP-dependent 6-phosphofructokinase [Bdellovibrionaceae bacterium]|nr:ATP-dependent 6-phosphofructokinase [Bdellovibrionales bacterium]MCB9086578.1 ATP-dependent 6-phosphofructokinase [Pseudobdellovibrionaceae bacterium]